MRHVVMFSIDAALAASPGAACACEWDADGLLLKKCYRCALLARAPEGLR